ncbi:sigma-70 family RNA polymerase sigma factor [Bacillus sp. B-jedd]|uniref:sigma-70 family RNA polymerase sigma factor n=1 Tax=Bacillus sp. B-jedd TaxID=1476857 RepID=UPI000515570F|nr:sigma-70 family RNA polymerase sigma factor [Bacillus sp. B-jedd]CEG25537.1 RNA polymerase ECF-type sigma factor [Bacillus sp. B-jedd]
MKGYAIEGLILQDKEETIDHLMTAYGQEILQLVYSYVKNKAVAEDLTQEIFIKCFKSLHTYNGRATIRTWLWRIAINTSKDYLKSWYNNNVIVSEDEPFTAHLANDAVEQEVIKKDEDAQLAAAVMRLPVIYREVIYLFYFEDLMVKEIADLVGMNQNTVKTRLKRAKELLKEQLEG